MTAVMSSADDRVVVIGDLHGVRLADAVTGMVQWQGVFAKGSGPEDGVRTIAISADGRWVAAADRYRLHVWAAATGDVVATKELSGLSALAFSAEGRFFFAGLVSGEILSFQIGA